MFRGSIRQNVLGIRPIGPTGAAACLLAVFSGWIASAVAVSAQQVPSSPGAVLRIKSAFAAPLWRIDVDRDGKTFVSSSAYKTVHVWSLPNGDAPRAIRLPLRDEQRRRAHGVAVSPDGSIVAYSVPPLAEANGTPKIGTARIYVTSAADGRIQRVIDRDIPTRPQALKFSNNGAYAAAVLSSGCGVRVWETTSWSLITADDVGYGDPAAGGSACCADAQAADCHNLPDTTGVIFVGSDSEPVLITSGDTGIRKYVFAGGGFVLAAPPKRPAEIQIERPEGVAPSPDGKAIAVGDRRRRGSEMSNQPVVLRVAILSLATLEPLREPYEINEQSDRDTISWAGYFNQNFALHRVAWVAGNAEEWVYAGGYFACRAGANHGVLQQTTSDHDLCLVRWSVTRPNDPPQFIPHGTDRLMDIINTSNSRLIVATQRSVAVMSPDGALVARPNGSPFLDENRAADFRGSERIFSISADGSRVSFNGYRDDTIGTAILQFNAGALELTENGDREQTPLAPNKNPEIISDPTPTANPRRSRWWTDTEGPPRFRQQELVDPRLDRGDIYRAVALHPGSQTAVVGSSNFLRIVGYGDGAPRIRCELPISEEAFRVNITPDAAIVVAGHSDGTLRWYRNSDIGGACRLDLILSVYVTRTANGKWTWITWLPSGEFANDPAAHDLLSWQVVESDGTIKTIGANELLGWYRDAVVKAAIGRARQTPVVAASPPPGISAELVNALGQKAARKILTIASALDGTEQATFRYRVNIGSAPSWPQRFSVRTGDRHKIAVIEKPGASPQDYLVATAPGRLEFDLVLPDAVRRENDPFRLCFFLDDDLQQCRDIWWNGSQSPPPPRKLWAIIVGVSKYDTPGMKLDFAQNDAVDLAKIFVNDFKKRGAKGKPIATSDFSSIDIELIVSPTNNQIDGEISTLAALPYVKRRPATREGILGALKKVATLGEQHDISNDLFLFYFSGHGFAHPFNKDSGLTALATPATSSTPTPDNFDKTTLTSRDLVEFLEKISARKLVILDACRASPAIATYEPLKAGALTTEFGARALDAYFYFSTRDGHLSLEQSEFAFDITRKPPGKGNGLFTFGLLKALISPDAKIPGPIASQRQLNTNDISNYLRTRIFDKDNPKSVLKQYESKRGKVTQAPSYIPARSDQHLVLRTLD